LLLAAGGRQIYRPRIFQQLETKYFYDRYRIIIPLSFRLLVIASLAPQFNEISPKYRPAAFLLPVSFRSVTATTLFCFFGPPDLCSRIQRAETDGSGRLGLLSSEIFSFDEMKCRIKKDHHKAKQMLRVGL